MYASKKKKKGIRIFLSFLLVAISFAGIFGWSYYRKIYAPNFLIHHKQSSFLYIPTGSTFDDVTKIIDSNKFADDINSFIWLAEKKSYVQSIKPGKYMLQPDMSNNQLINMLRSGQQVPIKLSFNSIRTKQQFAKRISEQIEATEESLLQALNTDTLLAKYGCDTNSIMAIFIPNTYSFYWNTSAVSFVERMFREYQTFWNDGRKEKASLLQLSPEQVVTLASIVEQETSMNKEKPTVAGVYINRLQKNMLLQADPTLIFAWNDFSIHRVLNFHKLIDSPFNTYKYPGLPPGPICIPSVASIDAVLSYKKHNYLYFCAKEDFSGYHNFAKDITDHMQNAKRYQAALNKKNIKK
ncbi:MAG: endolytic transglycosylase MltG [Bacteroidota bacterium]